MGNLFHNTVYPEQIYLGGTAVSKVMIGAEQIWPAESPNTGNGALYNWYAANNIKVITSNDEWRLPTRTDFDVLNSFLSASQGLKLRSTGTDHWEYDPAYIATNEAGLSAYGSGVRGDNGVFGGIKQSMFFWSSTEYDSTRSWIRALLYNSSQFPESAYIKNIGGSIRLIKTNSTLSSYSGNDGKTYTTVKISDQVWMSQNLNETKYRDLSLIPIVTDATEWSLLSSGAMSWYDNNKGYE